MSGTDPKPAPVGSHVDAVSREDKCPVSLCWRNNAKPFEEETAASKRSRRRCERFAMKGCEHAHLATLC
jgi:hypothetical protein